MMVRIVNLIFLVVFTTTLLSCAITIPTGADGPEKWELDRLERLVGQPREVVRERLGQPRKQFTLNDQQFMLYTDLVKRYSHTFPFPFPIPTNKQYEGTKLRCLMIEIDSDNLVNNYWFKFTGRGTDSFNDDIRCENLFFGESELKYIAPPQQPQKQWELKEGASWPNYGPPGSGQ
jgi:hypothetical protein